MHPPACARPRNITARTAAASSLMEKYQCPDAARVKLETSPATHRRGTPSSSNCATRRLSCDTVRTAPPPDWPLSAILGAEKLTQTCPQKALLCQRRLVPGLSGGPRL